MLNLYEWHQQGFHPMMQSLSAHYASEVDILMQKNRVVGAYSVAALQLLMTKFLRYLIKATQWIPLTPLISLLK